MKISFNFVWLEIGQGIMGGINTTILLRNILAHTESIYHNMTVLY